MDPEEDQQPPAPEGASSAAAPSTAASSDAVRNSPEYREQQKQLRAQARKNGDLERQLAEARSSAESERAAAEAARAEQEREQLTSILGAEGLQLWQELSDLSATNPIEAARRLHSALGGAAEAPGAPPAQGNAPSQQPPAAPPLPRTLSASSPLASATAPDPEADHIAALDRTFEGVRERVQRRERVRPVERSGAIIAYVESSLRRAIRGDRSRLIGGDRD